MHSDTSLLCSVQPGFLHLSVEIPTCLCFSVFPRKFSGKEKFFERQKLMGRGQLPFLLPCHDAAAYHYSSCCCSSSCCSNARSFEIKSGQKIGESICQLLRIDRRHFTQREKCCHIVSAHSASARRICSSDRHFLLHSTSVYTCFVRQSNRTHCVAQTALLRFVVDLLYNICCTTNPQQIEVMEFEA